jgi:hypothetical protein
MGELTSADVDLYTNGRLPADDALTTVTLNSALAAARRYCEWHVSPVRTETKILDGPGHHLLLLPTQRLVSLNSITEDGVTLSVGTLHISADGPVRVAKGANPHLPYRFSPRWSSGYSAITVNMTHGYDEVDAADWRLAVLDACERFTELDTLGMQRYSVDDIVRQWFESNEAFNTRLLEPFRLLEPV